VAVEMSNYHPEVGSRELHGDASTRNSESEDLTYSADDEDDELVYSRSSGLSTAFSMETLANPSTATSSSIYFSPSESISSNYSISSPSPVSRSNRSHGANSDSDSDSTVIMYNNASRCRRDPQEVVWVDEAWLVACDSRNAPSWNNDRLSLLHHIASWRNGPAWEYGSGMEDIDLDEDVMSDYCGKLLFRSVAICKSKMKSTVATGHHGGRALSPKVSFASSSSPKSSPSSSSSTTGFLSGKMYEYAKL
jgi:hypothetical protein